MNYKLSGQELLNAVGNNEARAVYYSVAPEEREFSSRQFGKIMRYRLPEDTAHPYEAHIFAKHVDRYYTPAGLIEYHLDEPYFYSYRKPYNPQAEAMAGANMDLSLQLPNNLRSFWGRGSDNRFEKPADRPSRYRLGVLAVLGANPDGISYEFFKDAAQLSSPNNIYREVAALRKDGIVQLEEGAKTVTAEPLYKFDPSATQGSESLPPIGRIIKSFPDGLTRSQLFSEMEKAYAPSTASKMFRTSLSKLIQAGLVTQIGEYEWKVLKTITLTPAYSAIVQEAIRRVQAIGEGDMVECKQWQNRGKEILLQPDLVEKLLSKNASTR